jgi:hypothetical protein
MNQYRPTGTPVPGRRPEDDTERDDLTRRITDALRSREPDAADTAATARRIAAHVAAVADDRSDVVTPFARRTGRLVITGVVASSIVVAGTTAAAATNPYTGFAAAVEGVVQAVGVDWSAMPAGLTREQYDAFWDVGYSSEDQMELAELWSLDTVEVKARAGQMVLDGERLPFKPGTHTAPGSSAEDVAASQAFIDSGYTHKDLAALSDLWNVDEMEAKVRAGNLLLVGKPLPLPSPGESTGTSSPDSPAKSPKDSPEVKE